VQGGLACRAAASPRAAPRAAAQRRVRRILRRLGFFSTFCPLYGARKALQAFDGRVAGQDEDGCQGGKACPDAGHAA